jgi:hypothetical protein
VLDIVHEVWGLPVLCNVLKPDVLCAACVCAVEFVLVLLQLKPAGVSQLVQRVLDIEGKAEHWSLKDRCVLVCGGGEGGGRRHATTLLVFGGGGGDGGKGGRRTLKAKQTT